MNFLALDTSTEACSVAISRQGDIFAQFEICPQQHSQRLLPMLQSCLEQANLTLAELDFLAYGHGPGSFTGVRIATGIIQGLALGTNKPVVGVSTLAAMAQQAFVECGANLIAATHDARMNEVYLGQYQIQHGIAVPIIEEAVLPPAEVGQALSQPDSALVGTGWAAYPELAQLGSPTEILYPDAKFMLPLALSTFTASGGQSVENIQPVYLRDKVTWKKLPGRE